MDYAIIVAGGKGLRMGCEVPKQFLPIGGKPVLMRTIERFWEYSKELQIILVLPKSQQDYWRQLCTQYAFPIPMNPIGMAHPLSRRGQGEASYLIADGGDTRFHSVQNGLALIPDDAEGVVGVHDGVRPFVSVDVIRRCYEEARRMKAVIPVVPVVETLREIAEPLGSVCGVTNATEKSTTVPRDRYRLVQTPQTFDIQTLKAANRQQYSPDVVASFTDDATVVEAFGLDVTLVDGNRENIKLTTPFDLTIAEALLC